MIKYSSIYTKVYINNISPFSFDIYIYYIRLAISYNSSIVVLNLS